MAIAALGCLTFGRMFSGELLWAVAAVCALDWFLVNFVNRAVDLPEDLANRVPGVAWMAGRRWPVLAAFATLFASFVLVQAVLPALLPWRIAYHALGLAYNYPLLGRRLKQIYGVKNLASASGFLLTSFAYTLASAEASLVAPISILLLGAFFLAFEVSYEVIYDLRDADGDRLARVPTFPAVHGERRAHSIAEVLALASIAPLAAGWADGMLAWGHVVVGVAPVVQVLLLRRWMERGGVTSVDCVRLTWLGATLLATWNLWQTARLPGAL